MDATAIRKMCDKRWHERLMKRLDEQFEKDAQTEKVHKMLDTRGVAQMRKYFAKQK